MSTKTSADVKPRRQERIHTFDLLRGFFLIIILFDHLAYFPSGLDVITGRGVLYASSAEGFFLISGIVLGIVRGRKLLDQPFLVAAKKLLSRSFQLYLTSIILTLLFTFLGWAFFMNNPGLKYGIAPLGTPIWELLWNTITFKYIYGWADFLRFYAIFMFFTPIALWLLRKKLWYVLALISIITWKSYTLTPGGDMYAPIAWQLVFFSGFIIGFYWQQIVKWWRRIPSRIRFGIGLTLIVMFVTTAILSALLVFGDVYGHAPWNRWHRVFEPFFRKEQLPVARLMLGSVWFWGLFWLVRRFEPVIRKRIGWLLLPLGENSLYVYTIESFIVLFFHLFLLLPQPVNQLAPWYQNLALSLVALSIVWFMTTRKVLFRVIPR